VVVQPTLSTVEAPSDSHPSGQGMPSGSVRQMKSPLEPSSSHSHSQHLSRLLRHQLEKVDAAQR